MSSQSLDLLKSISPDLSVEELLKRLNSIEMALGEIEQQDQDTIPTSITSLASQLIDEEILSHKNKEVRLFTAVCLGELFRICCPLPPFNMEALKNVFSFLLMQLRGLTSPHSPNYERVCSLLENLSEVKCCLLCLEIPEGPEVMLEIFQTIFLCVHPDQGVKV